MPANDLDLSVFTEDELKAMYKTLVAAMFQGTREVYYGSKRVVYRNLEEMKDLKNLLAEMLGIENERNGRTFAEYHSDLHGNTGEDY